MRLQENFQISSGGRQERRVLLIQLLADGVTGWGECVAAEEPNYSEETVDTAWQVLEDHVLPSILGRETAGAEDVLAPVSWIRGNRMALAGLEMAAWDLEARLRDLPLHELLGGTRRPIPVGVSVGLQDTDEELVRKVGEYAEAGYRKIKLKIKPGRDVEMVRAVRRAFPDLPLMADANSAYTLADAPRLQELDELDLMMVEQPLGYDDFLDHARLQERMATPICLDESIRSVGDARLAVALGSCGVINIKPGRVGGFASSRRIHDYCRQEGVPVWCGGMLESGVGRGHNVALATLPGFTLPGDISASRRYWERDIVAPEWTVDDGTILPPEGPGIGVVPDEARIETLTRRVEVFF